MLMDVLEVRHSLMRGKIRCNGNVKLASELEQIAKELCCTGMSLYDAENYIKMYVIDNFGIEWYEKSGEAVHVIVEEVYNDAIRSEQPVRDYCMESFSGLY